MYYYSPFRKTYSSEPEENECVFCSQVVRDRTLESKAGVKYENDAWFWVVNQFPKFEGHTLLVPKRHIDHLEDETPEESALRQQLFAEVVTTIKKAFPEHGIEYFAQNGRGSQSTINHIHWHLVPASPDDELRSFEKLGHFYTTEPEKEKVLIYPIEISMGPDALTELITNIR